MSVRWVDYDCKLLSSEPENDIINRIEYAFRICYASEKRMENETIEDSVKFINSKAALGHLTPFEHSFISIEFTCDRGLSHEIVRHRLCAFNQNSSRYIKFIGDIDCIMPRGIKNADNNIQQLFRDSVSVACNKYQELLESGVSPQNARGVLPTCLATKLILSCNFREMMHIFDQRLFDKGAHPDIRYLMSLAYKKVNAAYPHIFNKEIPEL